MDLITQSFKQLYPEKEPSYYSSIRYSRKLKPYNANVKKRGKNLFFHLSKEWEGISEDIQIGLIQELLVKLHKENKMTMNMELYNLFIKNLHLAIPKTKTDEMLKASFDRINELYLGGMLDLPNLQWGDESTRLLGHYQYASDMITISTIFKNAKKELLDYVMYHEMLHKKFKFEKKNGRTLHHSPKFRAMERRFENWQEIEGEISRLARIYRLHGH